MVAEVVAAVTLEQWEREMTEDPEAAARIAAMADAMRRRAVRQERCWRLRLIVAGVIPVMIAGMGVWLTAHSAARGALLGTIFGLLYALGGTALLAAYAGDARKLWRRRP